MIGFKLLTFLIDFWVKKLPPKKALKLLLKLDNYLYFLTGRVSVDYGRGLHTKHKHLRYYQFFVKNLNKKEKVLDIGCGNGFVDYQIVSRLNVKILGIDLDRKNIETANKSYKHVNLKFICGDALKRLPKEKFDVVILSNVLEHIKERVKFLKNLKRQINPKRFLIRVPCFERDWRVPLKKELAIDYRLDKGHFIEYTQERYFSELKKAGLKPVSTEFRWGEIWSVIK